MTTPLLAVPAAAHPLGDALRAAAHVLVGVVLADAGAPAVGAEDDGRQAGPARLGLGSTRTWYAGAMTRGRGVTGIAAAAMTDQPGRASPPTGPSSSSARPRSGTTMLRLILDSHPRISCGEETHFLPDDGARRWAGTGGCSSATASRAQYWPSRLRRRSTATSRSDYAARRGKARWADKDPANTLLLPFVDELFPDAQYVHLSATATTWSPPTRTAGDTAPACGPRAARGASTSRRPVRSADASRRVATTSCATRRSWRTRRPQLDALFAFLGEAWDPAVLEFDEAEHDGTERYRRFTAERRERGRRRLDHLPVAGRRGQGQPRPGAPDDAPPQLGVAAPGARLPRLIAAGPAVRRGRPRRAAGVRGARRDPPRRAAPPPA